jgi:hypothetical protein
MLSSERRLAGPALSISNSIVDLVVNYRKQCHECLLPCLRASHETGICRAVGRAGSGTFSCMLQICTHKVSELFCRAPCRLFYDSVIQAVKDYFHDFTCMQSIAMRL